MKRILSSLCLFAALATAVAAHADAIYNYSYSGAGVSGSGEVSITETPTDGVFLVTSIGGQVNGSSITGLLPVGTYKNNDNLFYFTDTYLDEAGVSFLLDDGANVNIYYANNDWFFQGDGNFVLDTGDGPDPMLSFLAAGDTTVELDTFTFAPVAATPEPPSYLLLGTGVLGVVGLARRRFHRA